MKNEITIAVEAGRGVHAGPGAPRFGGQKLQRTGALQDAARGSIVIAGAERLGLRRPSAAFYGVTANWKSWTAAASGARRRFGVGQDLAGFHPKALSPLRSASALQSGSAGLPTNLVTCHSSPVTRRAFSLVEVLMVVTLLSLIIVVLMGVFNSTQSAFRAGVTQSDVLEGGRAAVDLITSDLRQMTPSDGVSNANFGPVNFFTYDNSGVQAYLPLGQSLPGSGLSRTNVLNYFFLLGRENTKWTAAGYVVNATNSSPIYPLYRFYAETNISTSPGELFRLFLAEIALPPAQWTNMSHVIDGVVHLVVRAYDVNGCQMINNVQYDSSLWVTNKNVLFYLPVNGEVGFAFFSNNVPASVELELGMLEDRVLAHAGSLPYGSPAQTSYLMQRAGNVHLFRQRVSIPNVDPAAYQ